MIVVDVNLLVYAYNKGDQRHRGCVEWLEKTVEGGETIGIPWHCVMGFLRIMTASIGAKRPLSTADAVLTINGWFEHPQFMIPSPGRRFWSILQQVSDDSGTRGGDWSDAYLAALAMEYGAGLATFDRDFRKFKGLKLIEL
jgi:toxin-antitoxin system PIN domain toxin